MHVDDTITLLAENGYPGRRETNSGSGVLARVRLECGAVLMFYRTNTAVVQGRFGTTAANDLDRLLHVAEWNARFNANIQDETRRDEVEPEPPTRRHECLVHDDDAPTEPEDEPPGVVLSDDQAQAFAQILAWLESPKRTLSLGGYAGTGKTTLIKEIVRHLQGRVRVCAPTGKAAHVLRCKGVSAQTLHSLIYRTKVVRDPITGVRKWKFVLTNERFGLVIVDEASMLSTQLVTDLLAVARRVLYVGDHGQLQPIGDDPGIMHEPDIRLENIHRQAEGSPIILFAHHVREGREPETFGDLCRVQRGGSLDIADFDITICGFNKTRVSGNAWARRRRGFSGDLPQVGERVICLQNDANYNVFNGQLCTVREIGTGAFTVEDDAGAVFVDVPFDPLQFGRQERLIPVDGLTLWDFGYVATCHKMQGSEARRVAVLEEIGKSWSFMRWRYTAATRASEELRWVLGD